MLPNILWFSALGKLVFVMSDIIAGYMLFRLLELQGVKESLIWKSVGLFVFNPLVFAVSTRGSADILISLLVLGATTVMM